LLYLQPNKQSDCTASAAALVKMRSLACTWPRYSGPGSAASQRFDLEYLQLNHAVHNKLVSFIWSIADDCLRDVYVRGKYRDVILPMVVLRRLDALLEPSKAKVMEELAFQQREMSQTELDDSALRAASGYVFYNTSKWTLSQLQKTATNNQQILLSNVEDSVGQFHPSLLQSRSAASCRGSLDQSGVGEDRLDE